MKKQPRAKVVKALASQFEDELNKNLPVVVRSDGSVVYKNYFIKAKKNGNWGLFSMSNRDEIEEFCLKTCALMAAKAYNNTQIEKFKEIKQLDTRYWSSYYDTLVFRNNIKKATGFERYLTLLNRLEESECQSAHFKDEISRMFKWSFV